MIPFISAINVISTGKCCAGINKFLEYSSIEGQSDTSTTLNYLARSEHRTYSLELSRFYY